MDDSGGLNGVLRISLSRQERPVDVVGEDGEPRRYALIEMTGDARDGWLNGMAGRMGGDRGGGVREFKNLQASLISLCLHDEQRRLVSQSVIANWPASTQHALFKVCQEMNALTEESVDRAKKA